MSVIAYSSNNTLVIGQVSHYHFYQSMNHISRQRPSQKYQPKKTIIPPVPRQHDKAPVNSPLSFIRQEKVPRTPQPFTIDSTNEATSFVKQRPPLSTVSTTDLLKNLPLSPKKEQLLRRPRKVSFDENVMVICTRFNDDDDDDDESNEPIYHGRRHSTGEPDVQQRKPWLTFKKSLKRWKYALPSSSASHIIV